MLTDTPGKRLLQAGQVFFHFQDDTLFMFYIVNAEIYFGKVEIRRHLHLCNGYQWLRAVDIASFILQYHAEMPFD